MELSRGGFVGGALTTIRAHTRRQPLRPTTRAAVYEHGLQSSPVNCAFLDNQCEWPIKVALRFGLSRRRNVSIGKPRTRARDRGVFLDQSPGIRSQIEDWQAPQSYCGRRQEFALNLSAKRRLCNTVGKRFIDGTARCWDVSTARSRAAATTNLARSNQSLVLRGPRWPGAKSCALVNFFMICPPVGR
jgi:hypothetical protein